MNFYELWAETRKNCISEKSFIGDFLDGSEQSLKPLFFGSDEELKIVCTTLLETSIDALVSEINEFNNDVYPEDIVQFSTFEHAIIDVPRIIRFENRPLTFTELGKQIMNSKQEGACKKYGENHSKLAAQLSLVRLERSGSFIVSDTNLGIFSVGMDKKDRLEMVRRLALRNAFVKKIISEAKKGICDYEKLAESVLSKSTCDRRKSNVRFLVTLILENTENNYLLDNINW